MKTLKQLHDERAEVELKIKWAQFALKAPKQFVYPLTTANRKNLLMLLLYDLEQLTKQITDKEFEERTLFERQQTKEALAAMGIPYRTERGIFYLLP